MITSEEATKLAQTANESMDEKIRKYIDLECENISKYIERSARDGNFSITYYFSIDRKFPADSVVTAIAERIEKLGFHVERFPVSRSTIDSDTITRIEVAWK